MTSAAGARLEHPGRAGAALVGLVALGVGSHLLGHPVQAVSLALLAVAVAPLVDPRAWPLRAVAPAALMLGGARAIWHTPWGTALDGVVHGLLIALIALGIAIVYRANRIVNFAAADLGGAPALLALELHGALGWSVPLALLSGLGASVLLGVLVELLFLRRFFRAPRMIATVATIGVTQVLVGVGLLLPQWIGRTNVLQWPPLVHLRFAVGSGLRSTRFDGNDVLVLLVVPAVLVALAAFFRFTSIGVALRATAESADRASLLGIPVRRLQSVVWALVAALAFAAMSLRIGVDGVTLGRVLDPTLLLTALGAAVIGRMERLPTVAFSAVGLGVVWDAVRYHFASGDTYRSAFLAGIIAVALLAQRADLLERLAHAATSTWEATREVRPLPAELRDRPEVRIARATIAGVVAIGLALVPVLLPENRVKLCATIGIYAIVGISLVVLTGWGGQVSLGQMAFVGVAGAFAGTLATRWHVDTALVLLAAGAFGAVVTSVVGVPTLRARGLAFAVMTLAFALASSDYLLNQGYSPLKSWVPAGRVDRTHVLGILSVRSETRFYLLVVTMLGLALVAARGLRATRTGRVLIGVRDNERAAEAYAIGARRALVLAFAISGFLAGVAGALFVLQQQALDSGATGAFSADEGLRIFSMVVVGGLGSISGAVLGAVFVFGAQWFLPSEWALLSTGAGLLLVLLLVPGGLGAALGDGRDGLMRWWARRRGIRVPSLVADTLAARPLPEAELRRAVDEAATQVEDLAEIRE